MSDNTKGKAFILSYSEVMKYMSDPERRIANNRAGILDSYWLRSPGNNGSQSQYVNSSGEFSVSNVNIKLGVRPALWLDESFICDDNIFLDGREFKVLAVEDGRTLIVSKDTLFESAFSPDNADNYIPYDKQVGESYLGSIREAVDKWFAAFSEDSFIKIHALEPITLLSENKYGKIDDRAITKPIEGDPAQELMSYEELQAQVKTLSEWLWGLAETYTQGLWNSLNDVLANSRYIARQSIDIAKWVKEISASRDSEISISLDSESRDAREVSSELAYSPSAFVPNLAK